MIHPRIKTLFHERTMINCEIQDLQDKCPHENVDVYEDSRQREPYYQHYYDGVDVTCQDCWKVMWFEEGTEGYDKYFPKIKS